MNDIIQYILKKNKLRLDINLNQSKAKKTLIGNNMLACQKLKWSSKKNIFTAANEIYKLKVKNKY